MFKIRHYQPANFPDPDNRPLPGILELIDEIVPKAYDQWVPIPGSGLEVHLERLLDSTQVRFTLNGMPVYIHIFCRDGHNLDLLFEAVRRLTWQYLKSEPEKPAEENWIYSIPTSPIPLNEADSRLIHGVVFTIYAGQIVEHLKCLMLN